MTHPTEMPTGGVINPDEMCDPVEVTAAPVNPIVQGIKQKLWDAGADIEHLRSDYDEYSYEHEKLGNVAEGVEYALGHITEVESDIT